MNNNVITYNNKSNQDDELITLHNIIRDIAQKQIDNCINIPRIYTMICYEIVTNDIVKAVFPQDVESVKRDSDDGIVEVVCNQSKIMTLPNYSGYQPLIGQGLLILTTGGTNLTGGFVIAVMGYSSILMTELNHESNDLNKINNEELVILNNRISELNIKIEENNKDLIQIQNELNDIKSRLLTLEG